MQGTVKFFDNDRGFGFISREGGDDVFVHVSNLQVGVTTLAEGQTVEFDVGPGRKSEEAKKRPPSLSRWMCGVAGSSRRLPSSWGSSQPATSAASVLARGHAGPGPDNEMPVSM